MFGACSQTLTLLIMTCCAHRKKPNMDVLWETLPAADWDWYLYLHQTEVWDSYRRIRGRIKNVEGIFKHIRRTTITTKLVSHSTQWLSQQPKCIHELVTVPRTYDEANDCLLFSQWERVLLILERIDAPHKGDVRVWCGVENLGTMPRAKAEKVCDDGLCIGGVWGGNM